MPNGPTKIVLIRAGRYDYAEVDLSGSIQIVGPNNTGKTTLINTLQFLYVDDLRTMNFAPYTLEQTLNYYFPSQYSYALFQCTAAAGQCVVGWRGQSRASGGEPERFCYQGGYDPADFFETTGQVSEPRNVSGRLALKGFRLIKSAQDHRELLLPPDKAEARGLGLVALRDADRFRRFRESLKDLLSLSSISQDQMRDRLLTLADVRADIPALDVRKLFGEDYDKIRERRGALARFHKNQAQVRELVEKSEVLARLRRQLMARWEDLRAKNRAFEHAHSARIAELKAASTQQEQEAASLGATMKDRGASRDLLIAEQGALDGKLAELERKAQTFANFDRDLADASRQNLKHEEQRLARTLADAETESSDKAQQKLALYSDLVRRKESAISNFDRLAITALRRHFKDEELDRGFQVLHFGLLETPLGSDGITVTDEAQLLAAIRAVVSKVHEGIYEDANVRIVLPAASRTTLDLAHVDKLREELHENSETLDRWQSILKAINERESLASRLKQTQADLAAIEKQIVLFEDFAQAQADIPRLQRDRKKSQDQLVALERELTELEGRRRSAERAHLQAMDDIRAEENSYNETMGRHNLCHFPAFSAVTEPIAELPSDFGQAIAQYLHHQAREEQLRTETAQSLKLIVQMVGETYNGADDHETTANLAAELEGLADKSVALERDWNALIQGLRGTFAGVLNELDAIRVAVTDLNRQFAKVQVSNLRSIKLEVHEAGDLVSWIKRLVDLQQPGLFDDDTSVDQTLRNFRQKLEGSPLISFAQLFTLGISVESADGVRHEYADLRQIESHGTTIAVKVLFNLLVLRRYLREDQCLVPFFLDEVQALDPANRQAILATARRLGFIAITAAPEAITEVDALYFLQPQQGRIVLRHRHRLGIQPKAATPE